MNQATNPEADAQHSAAFAEVRRWFRDRARPHVSMLRWHRCVGYARHAGVGVDIYEPPAVAPDAHDIEYLPGIATTIDGVPMTPEQAAATKRLLVQMATDARDALAGGSTLVVVMEPRK